MRKYISKRKISDTTRPIEKHMRAVLYYCQIFSDPDFKKKIKDRIYFWPYSISQTRVGMTHEGKGTETHDTAHALAYRTTFVCPLSKVPNTMKGIK